MRYRWTAQQAANNGRRGQNAAAKWKFVAIYYAIACLISWMVWAPVVLGRDGLKLWQIAPSPPLFISIGTLGPLIACYWTHWLETGDWHAVQFIPRQRGRIVWIILAPLLILFCFFVVFPAFLSSGNPAAWHWHFGVLTGLLVPMFNYNLFGGPLFEEFGWRGFLLTQVQQTMSPWAATIVVGVMWAAWHWPLFIMHWVSASPAVFVFTLIGVTMVMSVPFNASGQSVIAAILMHSAFNASSRFVGPFFSDSPTRNSPSPELLIAAAFLLVGVTCGIVTKGTMAAPPQDGAKRL